MNYYIVFVLVVAVVCVFVSKGIPAIMSQLNKDFDSDTEYAITGLCVGIVVVALLSPIIYEFKPISPNINQYEILRKKDGSVIGLREGVGGFHRPFFSVYKFVCLPNSFQLDQEITFPADACLVSISYKVVCSDPMLAYRVSNGQIYTTNVFSYTDEPNIFFVNWLAEGLRSVMVIDEQQTKPPTKSKEIYSWFLERAKVWSDNNGAGCHIEVESPYKVDTSNFYTVE